MATRNDKPGIPLDPNKVKFSKELSARLFLLEEELLHVVSLYHFHRTAIQTMILYGWPEPNDKLMLGLTLTTDWLAEQDERVIDKLHELKRWVKAANAKNN